MLVLQVPGRMSSGVEAPRAMTALEDVHGRIVYLTRKRQRMFRARSMELAEGRAGPSPTFIDSVKVIDQELYGLWEQKRLLLSTRKGSDAELSMSPMISLPHGGK